MSSSNFKLYPNLELSSIETQIADVASTFPVTDQSYSPQVIETSSQVSLPLTSAVGTYTVISKVVSVSVEITITSTAGTTGGLPLVVTLPIPISSTSKLSIASTLFSNIAVGGANPLSLNGEEGDSFAFIERYNGMSPPAAIVAGDVSAGAVLRFSGVYFIE